MSGWFDDTLLPGALYSLQYKQVSCSPTSSKNIYFYSQKEMYTVKQTALGNLKSIILAFYVCFNHNVRGMGTTNERTKKEKSQKFTTYNAHQARM